MAIYKPSELRLFLSELGINPQKMLSQNFLIDGNIIRKIVATAQVEPGDLVLEIGPGPGSLSEALLEKGAHLLAVEKDRTLAAALERFKSEKHHLEVFCEDIIGFPIQEVLAKRLLPGKKAKVIANLPYHLTTPILTTLVPLRHLFSSLTVMVQEEVARRFTAVPGTKEYSSLSIYLNYYCTPRYAFGVSNNCFYPPPKVQSAVAVLELKEPPTVSSEEDFFKMVRMGFMHRRKMLRASLRELFPSESVEEALRKLSLPPQARPEELSLSQFLQLFEMLQTAE